eukprot:903890-Amphidinium_carterae.2
MTREFEIDRRDAIRARNEANERRQEEQRQQPGEQQQDIRERHRATPEAVAARPSIAKATGRHEDDLMVNVLSRVTTDPNLENWYVPMPGPPRPPPPKQPSASQQRDMEQAMAIAKAKNAKNAAKVTGMLSRREEVELNADGPRPVVKPPPTTTPKKPPGPFFESPYRSEDDETTGQTVMSPSEPLLRDGTIPYGKMVMSPSMPMQEDDMEPPVDWATATAIAAKKAAA